MAELFGFSITRQKKTADPKQSFTQPQADDGTQTIAAGGYFGQYLDMEGTAKTEQDLIRRYREIALHPECDMAIEDIVNEAIVANELKDAIRLSLEEVPFGAEVRRKIEDEFKEVHTELVDQILKDESYAYHHDWVDGQIVLSDQWMSIHKRWQFDRMEERVLHRIALDYSNVYKSYP